MPHMKPLGPYLDAFLSKLGRREDSAGRWPGEQGTNQPPYLGGYLPWIGHGLSLLTRAVAFQREGHRHYGDVFTAPAFGLDLTFVTGQASGKLLQADKEEFNLLEAYRQLFGKLAGDILIPAKKEVLRGLALGPIRRDSRAFAEFANDIISRSLATQHSEFDALKLCSDIVINLSCWHVCGDTVPSAQRNELAENFYIFSTENAESLLTVLVPYETPSLRRRSHARLRIKEIIREEINRRIASNSQQDDFMASVMRCTLGEHWQSHTEEQMEDATVTIMGIMFGAHFNTYITLAACLLDLLTHPRELAAVLAEQHRVLTDRPLDYEALMDMPALFRCITETLRLRSGGAVWRRTLQDCELGGYELSKGRLVGTMMGLVNLDPSHYTEPGIYFPDRYLSMKTDCYQSPPVTHRDTCYRAFGAGRHLCPGRALSYIIVGTALTQLLQKATWELRKQPLLWVTTIVPALARPLGDLRIARIQPSA